MYSADKISEVKEIAAESKGLRSNGHKYFQLNTEISTGRVWADVHYSCGLLNLNRYESNNIIICGVIHEPISEEEVERMVSKAVSKKNLAV